MMTLVPSRTSLEVDMTEFLGFSEICARGSVQTSAVTGSTNPSDSVHVPVVAVSAARDTTICQTTAVMSKFPIIFFPLPWYNS